MVKIEFDSVIIEQIADMMQKKGLTELEIEQKDWYIRLSCSQVHDSQIAANNYQLFSQSHSITKGINLETTDVNQVIKSKSNSKSALRSPIIGTAYLKPDPTSQPYCKVGDSVKKGQTVLIVESMKVMNHIAAHKDGIVQEICVSDAQPVEFDDILMIIE